MIIDPIKLSQELIRCPSITPKDEGALDVLEQHLSSLGFKCERLPFSEEGTETVDNLYATYGGGSPNLCFAGHTDVVPTGDIAAWTSDPFAAEIHDNILIGRGVVDMKTAIASWISAISSFLGEKSTHGKSLNGKLSLLITGDEEGPAINGTRKMLNLLQERGENIDACIVGEPTSAERIGDTIKIGRRGSVNFVLTVDGKQGHVAYPGKADNPVTQLIKIASSLKSHTLDEGTDYFPASNLEITSLNVDNKTHNVIPPKAQAYFNIRFNNLHSGDSLAKWVDSTCREYTENYTLKCSISGEAFLTPPGHLSALVSQSIKSVIGINPDLSTTGGTSDARFIKTLCPVVEFGLLNKTAHHIDEQATIEDITSLTAIYKNIIHSFFVE